MNGGDGGGVIREFEVGGRGRIKSDHFIPSPFERRGVKIGTCLIRPFSKNNVMFVERFQAFSSLLHCQYMIGILLVIWTAFRPYLNLLKIA